MWPQHFPEACGQLQSPIDIKCSDPKPLNGKPKLTWKYIPENCTEVTNTGYCWKVHVHCEGSGTKG